MSRLAVWMHGTKIGTLQESRGSLAFSYTDEALELGVGRPLLSVSMPTRPGAYRGRTPAAFFEGLLPEGEARRMIAYDFDVADEVFALLSLLGRDCAGALIVLPDGEAPQPSGLPESIDEVEVGRRLRNLPDHPLGVDDKVRASLAGMQQKLLLARLDDGWGLPVNGAPSTHILKPPSRDVRCPDLIVNEAFCLRIGRHLGLEVAEVEIGEFDGVPVLIIERFDRTASDAEGKVSRVHQEDSCQAHGIDGSYTGKYERSGGPSLRQCATLLGRWSREGDALERLLGAATLTVLVGNADGHGKNLSLLHSREGAIRLAPVYDVFSSLWYLEHSVEPGMRVNGVADLGAVSRDDLFAEAASWGLRRDAAATRIEELLSRADDAISRAADDLGPPESLVELLQARAHALCT